MEMKQIVQKQAGYQLPSSRVKAGSKQLKGLAESLSQVLDKLAGFCMVAVMGLVVSNIILRAVFNRPILGTYDYVGFLTALVIGLALANCAFKNGHIAVSFVVEHFPAKAQAGVDVVVNSLSLFFWGLVSWQLWVYAGSTINKGLVSPTTQTPLYPFIYLVSLGFFALCLVLLVKLFESVKRVIN